MVKHHQTPFRKPKGKMGIEHVSTDMLHVDGHVLIRVVSTENNAQNCELEKLRKIEYK